MSIALNVATARLATPGAVTPTAVTLAPPTVPAASSSHLAPATTVLDTQGGAPGTTAYTYQIVAVDALGHRALIASHAVTLGNATLTVTNFNTLTWTKSAGGVADHYDIYRSASAGTPATVGKIGSVLNSATATFNDTGLAADGIIAVNPSTSVSYMVVAVDISGNSSLPTSAATTTTSAATIDAVDKNTVTWTKSAGADHYGIYRTAGGAAQGLIGSVLNSATATIDDTGQAAGAAVPAGVLWGYAITAVDAVGNETDAGPVATVTNAPAMDGTVNHNTMTWSAVPSATSYNIRRTQGGTSPATTGIVGNTAGTSFNDTATAGDNTGAPSTNQTASGTPVSFSSRRGRERVEVTGTFVCTVAIDVSKDGHYWFQVLTTTTPGIFSMRHRRWRRMRVRVTGYTSGTPVVNILQ